MISNCIFTWGFTSRIPKRKPKFKLWIDFKLYFYVRIHKKEHPNRWRHSVVNWFQIVFLREDSQENLLNIVSGSRCELISNCIFTWGFTRKSNSFPGPSWLWIDFKLYFYVRIHKQKPVNICLFTVVNWFQIVFLREDSQA